MKRNALFILTLVALLAIFAFSAGSVLADNGPHGNYTALTDACAGCHRAHTASAAKLLVSDVPNLCYTCHGTTGAGADTDVVDGVFTERDGVTEVPAEKGPGTGLKAGGFDFTVIDTNWDTVTVSQATTSKHMVDGSLGTAWGNGVIGSGAGASIALSCTSCHDPHGGAGTTGGATYRLLRAIPTDSGAAGGIDVTDESSKIYSVSNTENQYFGEGYGSRSSQLTNWCSQCHTRHNAPSGSGSTDSGDPIFAYRHTTGGVFLSCMSCHVAHGTSATAQGFAQDVAWPDGTLPTGDERSSLLRVDNRGVCELCHLK